MNKLVRLTLILLFQNAAYSLPPGVMEFKRADELNQKREVRQNTKVLISEIDRIFPANSVVTFLSDIVFMPGEKGHFNSLEFWPHELGNKTIGKVQRGVLKCSMELSSRITERFSILEGDNLQIKSAEYSVASGLLGATFVRDFKINFNHPKINSMVCNIVSQNNNLFGGNSILGFESASEVITGLSSFMHSPLFIGN